MTAISGEFVREINKPSDILEAKRKEVERKNRILSMKCFKRSFNVPVRKCCCIPEEQGEDEEEEEPKRAASTGAMEERRSVLGHRDAFVLRPMQDEEQATNAEESQSMRSESGIGSFMSIEPAGGKAN